MIKKISIVLTVIMLAGLVYMIHTQNQKQREYSSIISQMNADTTKYSLRIVELDAEVKKLEQEIYGVNRGNATTQFLITDISAETGAEIIASFEKYRYTGVIGITSKKYPGAKGCISADRAKELAEKGWKFCYAYDAAEAAELGDDASKAFTSWLKAAKKAAEGKELTLEPAILFPENTYKDNFNGNIKKNKIDIVILHNDNKHEKNAAVNDDDIWYISAQKWYDTSIANKQYGDINLIGGNITVEVNMDGIGNVEFDEIVDMYDVGARTNAVKVTDFEGMKEIQEENNGRLTEADELMAVIEEKKAEIQELRDTIESIEAEYYAKYEAKQNK